MSSTSTRPSGRRLLPIAQPVVASWQRGLEEELGAIVLDPFRDELFCAWRGRGAYLNGEPIACSDVTALSDAVLCGCSPKLHAVGAAVRSSAALHVPPFSAAPQQPCTCLPAPLSYQRAHSNIAITRCAGWQR